MLVDEPDPTSARMADQEGNMQDDLMEASIIMRHESFLLDGTEPTNTLVDDSASIVAVCLRSSMGAKKAIQLYKS
ncbi:hypothetical protein GUITHDRAFT_106544 [Guillardia theta CCMP2712]|uniref:Uncharacterized protein n=1 Tax=Guillardia theta (strain CCMP2712) TaxID=905079 RepID=L1JGB2_GUITC|nr:hypothetical protein GUITHDRAFT_106544 [Guillardia theta CCMP2712]EKX47558.1 hypothetical protein GUITHDRAFT_106544 [Guillardia theta CCMP2712]|eukprot:XP_005834538.1 hypothetical protein GUITHDRAFT_106544 [Guillardia theta CCMP2712]